MCHLSSLVFTEMLLTTYPQKKIKSRGRVWWLTPVTPALWRPRWADHEVRSLRLAWPTWWNLDSTKNTKISWVWWQTPVIPATWEAEAGELLEPRRWRLQWVEIAPPHSSLGNRARHSLSLYIYIYMRDILYIDTLYIYRERYFIYRYFIYI